MLITYLAVVRTNTSKFYHELEEGAQVEGRPIGRGEEGDGTLLHRLASQAVLRPKGQGAESCGRPVATRWEEAEGRDATDNRPWKRGRAELPPSSARSSQPAPANGDNGTDEMLSGAVRLPSVRRLPPLRRLGCRRLPQLRRLGVQ